MYHRMRYIYALLCEREQMFLIFYILLYCMAYIFARHVRETVQNYELLYFLQVLLHRTTWMMQTVTNLLKLNFSRAHTKRTKNIEPKQL